MKSYNVLLNKFSSTQLLLINFCFSGVSIPLSSDEIMMKVDKLIDNSDHVLVNEELSLLRSTLSKMNISDINHIIASLPLDVSSVS